MGMNQKVVTLTVPADGTFARSVRMTAANLAVLVGMNVDELEDIRMAAEEGFVYACGTQPENVEVIFTLQDGSIAMDFSLGEKDPEDCGDVAEGQPLELVELLLSAICDDFSLDDEGYTLPLLKVTGGPYAR